MATIENRLILDFVMITSLPQEHIFRIDRLDIWQAYAITVKKEEALNQQLNKQLKTELIVKLSSRYVALCFIFFIVCWFKFL